MELLTIYEDKEYYTIVKDIIRNKEFQRRRDFLHHQDSVYDHSLRVSYRAFRLAKKLSKICSVSVENATIAGLLHDFYTTPWRDLPRLPLLQKHGFVHGRIACENAYQFFSDKMNEKIADSITCHMFPLTKPPTYIEGWIVTLADKLVSWEVVAHPSELPRYLGIPNVKKLVQFPVSYTKKLYKTTEQFVSRMY